jgi:hypothetical protein
MYCVVEYKSYKHEVRWVLSKETGLCGLLIDCKHSRGQSRFKRPNQTVQIRRLVPATGTVTAQSEVGSQLAILRYKLF